MDKRDIYDQIIQNVKSGICEQHGDEVSVQCPGCGDEKQHFSLNIKKGLYNCFKCHMTGNLKVEMIKDRTFWSSLQHNTRSPFSSEARPICSLDGRPVWDTLLKGPSPFNPEYVAAITAMRYCHKRGMTKEQVHDYKVYLKHWDSRVYFPYWNEEGGMTFWMGRSTNDELIKPKTMTLEDAELPLFGRHIHIERDEVVLVEGVFDHFATPGSYALMGSNITGPQIIQLREDNIKRVFIILDPDANQQAVSVARKLANFRFDVFPVVIQGGKDPAELGRERMSIIVKIIKKNHPIRPQTIFFNP